MEEGRRKKEEFRDLRERTKAFALRVIRLYSSLPKTTEAQVIGKQLLRSGTSVGANYREAYRARSKAEYISIVGISLREIEETGYWFELLTEADIVPENKLNALQVECNELTAIFVSSVKKAKSNSGRGAAK
ncbi:MAG: four helix bundle protein [gamma proteobacterium endosymbiont of Lamellibrachia anaximandri]|nr:four helix bundle protein [gamma proteobacterium endosymbiont of Lamellibrachia anaximandri]MBL3618251.1 four helix bundle protein [gamma proteobacterium endosymbiont of Lamellibrachia anaximandri]